MLLSANANRGSKSARHDGRVTTAAVSATPQSSVHAARLTAAQTPRELLSSEGGIFSKCNTPASGASETTENQKNSAGFTSTYDGEWSVQEKCVDVSHECLWEIVI